MDHMDGIGLLKELQSRYPGLKVIILTAHGTIPDAVQATQLGAFGFLTKPVDKQELLDQVQKALRISGFMDSDEDWRAEIITRSSLVEEKLSQAHMVAGTDARVLITGESGTGKELLAQRHPQRQPAARPSRSSPSTAGPWPRTCSSPSCSATSRARSRAPCAITPGLFQAADGGTLLLDEIGDMPMRLQVKLLRVLQENNIRPIGATDAIPVNVRVISATHRDLQQLMMSGQFREDLYYRLNVVHIEMPPLNRRREDIPLLVSHFLAQISNESGVRKIYAPEAVELLATADWPGNIRQLANVVRQNVALSADTHHPGGTGAAVAGRHAEQTALVRRGARRVHAHLSIADPADHRRQRQPGRAPGEAQPHGLLQAAVAPPADAGRFQGSVRVAPGAHQRVVAWSDVFVCPGQPPLLWQRIRVQPWRLHHEASALVSQEEAGAIERLLHASASAERDAHRFDTQGLACQCQRLQGHEAVPRLADQHVVNVQILALAQADETGEQAITAANHGQNLPIFSFERQNRHSR